MPDEKKIESVNAEAGSSVTNKVDPNLSDGGLEKSTKTEPSKKEQSSEETVLKTQYEELQKKLGEQGQELGETREKAKVYDEVLPLLEKLESNPDLTTAIMQDKIDVELTKSILEGKITQKEAEQVTEAHKEVKEVLGKEKYDKKSPEEIEKLIESRVSEKIKDMSTKFDSKLSELERHREYQNHVDKFIEDTKDFPEYAEAIDKWVDNNADLAVNMDIKHIYDIVKGKALQDRYQKEEEERKVEAKKDLAGNAGSGNSKAFANMNKEELVDKILGPSNSPNSYL